MILAGGLTAAGGAGVAAWKFSPDAAVTAGGATALAVAALAGAAYAVVSARQDAAALRKEIQNLKQAQAAFADDISVAKTGMVAVHQALTEGGGAQKQRIQAMADEMAVLQKLVARLQDAAARSGANVGAPPVHERQTGGGLSETELLDLIRKAVAGGAVDLFLQPVVTLPQRRRRYYECFSRISDDRGGVLAADAYVATAEAAGLIAPIDNLLLFRAVQLVRRARSRNAHVGFFCNVSKHTLKDAGFLNDFIDFLEENADLAPSLILEIPQSDWHADDAELARYMQGLADLGVRFSLDRIEDFDIDAAMLRRRNFRFVKANAAALLGDSGPNAHQLKRQMALENIQLIVEKVETERELVELLEHDIEFGQGYLFGAPRAPQESAAAA